jgi:hypothetical protein
MNKLYVIILLCFIIDIYLSQITTYNLFGSGKIKSISALIVDQNLTKMTDIHLINSKPDSSSISIIATSTNQIIIYFVIQLKNIWFCNVSFYPPENAQNGICRNLNKNKECKGNNLNQVTCIIDEKEWNIYATI